MNIKNIRKMYYEHPYYAYVLEIITLKVNPIFLFSS